MSGRSNWRPFRMCSQRNSVRACLLWLVLIVSLGAYCLPEGNPSMSEFCQWESFHAACPPDHVLLMTSANYGRLRPGRCVRRQYGFIGCSADVLPYMDARCSGRSQCDVTVADISLQGIQPCPRDLTSFLVATYDCVKVPMNVIGKDSTCSLVQPITLYSQEGYLPTVDKDCSFVLTAAEGQRFNISLMDFGQMKKPTSSPGRMFCERFATVRDRGHPQWTNVCGGNGFRLREVFVSETNQVEVRVKTAEREHSFLLYYNVFGCAPPNVPPYMVLERSVGNPGGATVSCPVVTGKQSTPTWHLQCVNRQWVGEWGNCSTSASSSIVQPGVWEKLARDWSTPTGLSLVVTLGLLLGTIIGGLALAFAYVCIKREPLCHVDKEPPIYLDAVKPCSDTSAAPPSPATYLDSQEDYADIWLPGEDGQLSSSGYRTLSGESARRAETVSMGSCIVHGTTTLTDALCSPQPTVRVTTRAAPSPRHVFREGGGCVGKDAGNMYSYGALEPGWAIWREQTTGEDGQKSTSILV